MKVVSTIEADKIKRIGVGQGRNSEVYLAKDPQLCGDIALKEIPMIFFHDPSEYFNEAKNLFKNKHPNIVPVMYACQDSDCIRIVMPYFSKGSVQDYINIAPLTTRQLIYWSHQLLFGLHHVHSNGFIHYDIKPSNLLIHEDGSVLLSDFGQARQVNVLGVAENPYLYFFHAPPEAFQHTHATKQADIYQVGLTLYRMCNGEEFFRVQKPCNVNELRDKTLDGTYPRRDKFLPHVPRRLKTIIRKALKVDPAERYQTALELSNDLGQVDQLLDWQYYRTQTGAQWILEKQTHKYMISLENEKGAWNIKGKSIRTSDGLERTKRDWCRGPFSSFNQAHKALVGIFREME